MSDPKAVTISGLPVGFQLSQGDYVEIRGHGLAGSMNQITRPATAGASGRVTTSIQLSNHEVLFDE